MCENIFKNHLLRNHKGIKLKLYRNAYNISFYKNGVFIPVACVLSLLRQLKVSTEITMGIVEFGFYCYLTADIYTRVLQACSLSSPLSNVLYLSKLLNCFGCHGKQNAKFTTTIFKNHLHRNHKGDKAEILRKC